MLKRDNVKMSLDEDDSNNTNSSSTLELELIGDQNKTSSDGSSLSRFDSSNDSTNDSLSSSTNIREKDRKKGFSRNQMRIGIILKL
jgi:hypothetical protein